MRYEWGKRMQEGRAPRGFSESLAAAFDVGETQDVVTFLCDQGVTQESVERARALSVPRDVIETLYRNGEISAHSARRLRAQLYGCLEVDPKLFPRDTKLAALLPAHICMQENVIPWMRIDGRVLLATSRPERRPAQSALETPPIYAVATEADITAAIFEAYGRDIAHNAVHTVADEASSQGLQQHWSKLRNVMIALLILLVGCAVIAPNATFVALTAVAIAALWTSVGLKAMALFMTNKKPPPDLPSLNHLRDKRKPIVSILVPLHREALILERLVARLTQLDWPKHLLDVKFIIEEHDVETQAALQQLELPAWIHVIVAPDAPIRTKPRAMNIALDFCKGRYIGILDAEDRPDPDQIQKMVQRFNASETNVACVQARLDYYNPKQNWLSRCFTAEYASWFRVILPGIEALGLPVPLGGTSLYFRREALEELGRWDAQNVTEDADLGVRLYRHGMRMVMLDSTTFEEANCFALPWIRQRSRWLKGYMLTWLVHMRSPRQLHQDLGALGHAGFHCFFLSTTLLFLTAPFLWSFWAAMFGWAHPVAKLWGDTVFICIAISFFISEVLHLIITGAALISKEKRFLIKWVPSLHLYYPLATFAAYKALFELIYAPHYWDKTAHGHSLKLVRE